MSLPEENIATGERRSVPRDNIDSLIYLTLEPSNGGILLDLSPEGMRISVALPILTNTHVRFSIGAASSLQIEGIGHIAWIAQSRKSAGIRFLHFSKGSSNKIAELLKPRPLETLAKDVGQEKEPAPLSQGNTGFTESTVACQPEMPPITSEPSQAITTFPSWTLLENERPRPINTRADGQEQLALSRESPIDTVPSSPDFDQSAMDSRDLPEPALPHYGVDIRSFDAARVSGPSERCSSLSSTLPDTADTTLGPVPPQDESIGRQAATNPLQSTVSESPSQPLPAGLNDPLPTFTLKPSYHCPPSQVSLASKAILPTFVEIGSGLESDWHVRMGFLLLVGGFVALWQSPSLIFLAIALWIAGVLLLTNHKASQNTRKAER